MSYNKEKRLFGEAILKALDEKYDAELQGCAPKTEATEAHTAAMQKIMANRDARESKKKKIKVAALLVAAVLALAGCTMYVYRDEIRKFNLSFSRSVVTVTFKDGQKSEMRTLQDIYFLTYVPEGYKLTDESIGTLSLRYIWQNANRDVMIFEQHLMDSSIFGLDFEHGEIIPVEGYEDTVFHVIAHGCHYYLWNDGKYAMCLSLPTNHDIEEIRNIILGISTK